MCVCELARVCVCVHLWVCMPAPSLSLFPSLLPSTSPPPHTHTCALSWRVSWTARLDRCDGLVKDLRVTGASSAGQTPPSVALQPPAWGAGGRPGWQLTPSQPCAACKISGMKRQQRLHVLANWVHSTPVTNLLSILRVWMKTLFRADAKKTTRRLKDSKFRTCLFSDEILAVKGLGLLTW